MSKFNKKKKKGLPAVSTASLPDIVFMLLFFFMVATVMRETDLKVSNELPKASQLVRLENRKLIDYIYVGVPTDTRFGEKPVIQLNDQYATIEEIVPFIEAKRLTRDEPEWPSVVTALKVDKEAEMGIVSDIKQELRDANALKIMYATNEATE